jgi:hypothetical protein
MHSHFGKDTSRPYYVYDGSSLVIDPTFYSQKTKNTLKNNKMAKTNQKLYNNDITNEVFKKSNLTSGIRQKHNRAISNLDGHASFKKLT